MGQRLLQMTSPSEEGNMILMNILLSFLMAVSVGLYLVSIIEQSIANGSLEGKLSCPPLPESVKDLELPMSTQKHHPVVRQ